MTYLGHTLGSTVCGCLVHHFGVHYLDTYDGEECRPGGVLTLEYLSRWAGGSMCH